MLVTLRGVRGSVPAPGPLTVRYGGNTPCVQVQMSDGTELILDAGTGIRQLGKELMGRPSRAPIFVLLSHAHWDHVHGFPFFRPAYQPGWPIRVAGWSHSIEAIKSLLYAQMDGLSFPVEFGELRADIEFVNLGENIAQIGSATLQVGQCVHPGGCSCFRITEEDGGVLAYVTDNELQGSGPESAARRQAVVELCRGADVLIHDAQYLPEELEQHVGWGHSSYEEAVALTAEAGARHLILFHHDPDRSDEEVDEIQLRARKLIAAKHHPFSCEPAREGMQLCL